MKTSISLMIIGALALSGCHRHPPKPAAARGIVISQGRLVLPAVKGNPGAVYVAIFNRNAVPATLVHVDILGAHDAEMHETSSATMRKLTQVRIAPGEQTNFAPGGKHIMAFGLAKTSAPGSTGEIVLHFEDGKTISAPLLVEALGGGSGDMAGMTMSGNP